MARSDTGRLPYHGIVVEARAATTHGDARCYRLSSGGATGYPDAGGDIDGAIAVFTNTNGSPDPVEVVIPAIPGGMATLESAAAFSAGDLLATTADGRVQLKTAGQIAVARALESVTGAGQIVKVAWTSGRSA